MNNEKTKLSFDLKKIKENENIELKKADNNLPNSLWETYSAFCNTSGGIIILGIEVVEVKADKEWRAVYFKRK